MSRRFLESLYLLSAAAAVIVLAQTVYSQNATPEIYTADATFAGDRRPGILEEPSDQPVGDQAHLYLEVEREFEEAEKPSTQD